MPTYPATFFNSAEGQASGTTATQGSGGNTGGGSGDYFDIIQANSGTVTFQTVSIHGKAFTLVRSGTNQILLQRTLAADINNLSWQHYQSITALPSVNTVLFKGYSDAALASTSWAVAVGTSGTLIVLAGPSSTTVYTSAPSLIPANTSLRWEVEVVPATSIRCVVFSGDSGTVLADSGTIATTAVGATRSFRLGLLSTGSAPTTTSIQDVKLGSGPGLWGLASSAYPQETVSNAGAWTFTGAASIEAALDASTSSYIETPAAAVSASVRVGYLYTILPTGSVTFTYEPAIDVASPTYQLTANCYQGGSLKATRTDTISSTSFAPITLTASGLTGDMSTLELEFVATTN